MDFKFFEPVCAGRYKTIAHVPIIFSVSDEFVYGGDPVNLHKLNRAQIEKKRFFLNGKVIVFRNSACVVKHKLGDPALYEEITLDDFIARLNQGAAVELIGDRIKVVFGTCCPYWNNLAFQPNIPEIIFIHEFRKRHYNLQERLKQFPNTRHNDFVPVECREVEYSSFNIA